MGLSRLKVIICLFAAGILVSVGCGEDSPKSQECTDGVDDYCNSEFLIRCTNGEFVAQECSGNEYCGNNNGTFQCLPKDVTGCGAMHQACCAGNTCNNSLSCISGTCQTAAACGGQGQACCGGSACNDSLSCINNTCQATTACGGQGQACCGGSACNDSLSCTNNTCQATTACGGQSQACCIGSTCNGSLDCVSGTCQVSDGCGRQDQVCCAGNVCNASLNCVNNTCQVMSCGGQDQTCCVGNICNSSNLNCVANVCVSSSANRPPTFISLTTNTATMKPGINLEFMALLTDPDGIEDITAGFLTDTDGSSYGTFQPSSTAGLYTLQLSWAQINTVRAIEFPVGGNNRIFQVTFYDSVGNTAERNLTVKFECSNSSHTACSGTCVDLNTNTTHCGECNNTCLNTASYNGCMGGSCRSYCFPLLSSHTCDMYCGSIGLSCDSGYVPFGFHSNDCTGGSYYRYSSCASLTSGERTVLCPCK